ncbi:glycoside hydrolase family 71/99-like protein, partial [Planctomycetota bacterium]
DDGKIVGNGVVGAVQVAFTDDVTTVTAVAPTINVATVAEVSLVPSPSSEGFFVTEWVQGQKVWTATNMLYFKVPSHFSFVHGEPVYLQIEYLDSDSGQLKVQYDSNRGNQTTDKFYSAEIHTRSSRVDTGTFVTSYQMLEKPRLARRQNGGNDFRITVNSAYPLSVASVHMGTAPFEDDRFLHAISRPWLRPNDGPVKDFVDNQTVVGKVMTGYQGWFRTPNDLEDKGWRHWGRSSSVDPDPTQITIDQWPYLDEYQPNDLYPAGKMVLENGEPAHLFSSTDYETVQRHFNWMRKYNIDGAYLQRFVNRGNSGYYGGSEFVLDNVRKAAAQEGCVWALEYDISSLNTDDPFDVITHDWNWLVEEVGILNDPRYLHENGKPVLFIWGFSVRDQFSVTQADKIVDWFAEQELYLIGGVNWYWERKTEWYDHFTKYDQLLGWMERGGDDLIRQRNILAGWGVKILPHAWPGFSWHNLKKLTFPYQYTARVAGDFYWQRLYNAIQSGSNHIFLGMFDEYDEGTAIMPMSDSHPAPHTEWGHYIDNEGRDPFWYLRLSGAAHEMLLGQRPSTSYLPSEHTLSPAAFVGADATAYLGATNRRDGLVSVEPSDGTTQDLILGNHPCRMNVDPQQDHYFYFNIDDTFCFSNTNGQNATIEIEYYDATPGIKFRLQYDSVIKAYHTHPISVRTIGSGGWKNMRWNVVDGFFGNRQNGSADFRIALSTGSQAVIRRVSFFLPETQDLSGVPHRER